MHMMNTAIESCKMTTKFNEHLSDAATTVHHPAIGEGSLNSE